MRYTFTVTHNSETNTKNYVPFVNRERCQDAAGNLNGTTNFPQIRYQANTAPVANAGPDQTVVSGATVTLDGSASTDDGIIRIYTWFQASSVGTAPDLSDNNAVMPTLTAPTLSVGDASVTFSYALRVEDDAGVVSDSSDTVEITVTAPAPDTTAPTGRIEPIAATHDGMTAITMTVDFDEPVTGFVASDITVIIALPDGFPVGTYGPTITNFAVDPNDASLYTFTLTPRAPIEFSLRVAAGTYADAAGNDGMSTFRQVRFTGSNWPPIVAAGDNRSVVGGTLVTLQGEAKDIDGTVASYAWARTGGTTDATATLSDTTVAMPTFTANTLEAGAVDETHEFTLTVTDDDGASDTDDVTITVTAPFVTTLANAGDNQTVASGAMVTLDGSGSSVDRRRTATYNWERTGGTTGVTVTLTSETAQNPTFTAGTLTAGAANVTHTFTLTVTDSDGNLDADTVTVTVLAPDPTDTTPPEAVFRNLPTTHDGETAFTVQVKFTEPVIGFGLDKIFGSLTESRPDAEGVLRTNFTQDPNDPTLYTITLTPRDEISFRVVILPGVTDASGNALAQVALNFIRYEAPRRAPVADAGDDRVAFSGQTVMLDARGTSDFDDLVVGWLWEWTGDGTSTVEPTITNATAEQASFVAETLTAGASDVTHIIKLTVTDQAGNTDTDTVTITVREPFATPVANAGPDQLEVVPGATVQLDGSGSTVDRRRTATYSWERTSGTSGGSVTLSPSATVQNPTFTADTLAEGDSDVTHILTLTVTDGDGGSATDATDTVTITVKAPVPDTTGPTGVFEGVVAERTHDGMTPINFAVEFNEPVVGFTADDINRDAWNVPEGADRALFDPTISEFKQDSTNPLRYTFTLTPISDRQFTVSIPAKSITDAAVPANQNLRIAGQHFTYSAPSTNTPPVADAGDDQSVGPGVLVTLDGSGSMDAEGSVRYSWAYKEGSGSRPTLSDPMAAKPTFTADNVAPGGTSVYHEFTLTVTDEDSESATDDTRVVITSPFLTLAAEAGDPQTVVSGAPVTLDGSATIVDGRIGIAQYSWTQTSGTGGSLTKANTVMARFTAPALTPGAPDATYIFTLTVTDNQDNTANDTVTITVLAPLVAEAGDPRTVDSGATVQLEGTGTATGSNRTVTYAWARTGGTGDSSVAPVNPAALQTSFTAEVLNPGDTSVTHIFTLTVTDNRGSTAVTDTVTITVEAPEFPDLVAQAGPAQPAVPSGMQGVQLDGTGSTATVGVRTVTYAWTWTQTGGEAATVTLSDENILRPTFDAPTLTAGADDATYVFTLTVTDNQGSDAVTDTVTITVLAPVTGQVADAGADQIVASGATVTLDGRRSRVGNGPISEYNWTRESGTSTRTTVFTVQGGGDSAQRTTTEPTTTFVADSVPVGGDAVTHVFALLVTDANDVSSPKDTVTITVIAPLVAEAGTGGSVDHEAVVPLVGTGSTVSDSNRTVSYAWARTGGTGDSSVAPVNPAALQTSFTAETLTPGDTSVTHIFTLTVTDNRGSTAVTDTVTITVEAPDLDALAADAGTNQAVLSGATVQLEGTGTASDSSRTVSYAWTWTQTGGDAATVTLSDMTMLRPTFDAPTLTAGADDATYVFTLTVTDNQGSDTVTDTVTITVTAPSANTPPVAVPGPHRTVASGASVVLDGSASTASAGNTITAYNWRDDSTGSGCSNAPEYETSGAQLTFTAEVLAPGAADVVYCFFLSVVDSAGAGNRSGEVITTVTVQAPPLADAGHDRTVAPGAPVTLDGSGSRVSSPRTLTYAWMRSVAPDRGDAGNVTLIGENTATPTFTPVPLDPGAPDVTYGFTLTVTDSVGATHTDMVTITVTSGLFAEAGPAKRVVSGETVTLDGSGSQTDSTRTVRYAWTRTSGTGGTLIGETTLTPSFTAQVLNPGDADVTLEFTLTVSDDQSSTSETDTVEVTVTAPPFAGLTAEAGPAKSVVSGGTVTLDGSGSQTDSTRTVSYAWTQTDGTGGTLTGETTLTPSFTAPALNPGDVAVTLEFTLTVTDNQNTPEATDTVEVTVTPENAPPPPVADAGPPRTVAPGASVQLDGPVSSDSGETIVAWEWKRTGGTGDSNVNLMGANTARPSFTAPALNPGDATVTHVFTLTVTYEDGRTYTDTVTVTVSAVSVDIRVSDSVLTVQEGGSGTYRVSLGESPPQEVVIMATSGNEAVVQLKNARLVFNSGNWNEFQEVEINTVAGAGTENGTVRIRHSLVTAGVALNEPGDVIVTVRARADDPIPRPVGEFLETRATALINNQPGLSSFLELDGPTPGGGGGGSFTFQATDGRLSLNGGFLHNGVWGKVSGSRASSESGDTKSVTKSVLGSFGIHRKYSEHFLAGAMLQFDLSDHDRAGQVGTTHTIDGTGWLVGPYFAARHDTRPVYFEGRLLYGQSDNDIRFIDPALGVRTGSFDTRRLLAQLRVEGEIAVSARNHGDHGDDGGADGPRLRPYADARWIEDRAEAFTDNFGNRVPGQKVSIGQLELGSNVEVPVAVRTGAMTLTGGLGLVWSNTDGDYITSDSGGRGRGEIGFLYDLDDNLRIEFESFYDGIGSSRYEGYGLSLSAEMKF